MLPFGRVVAEGVPDRGEDIIAGEEGDQRRQNRRDMKVIGKFVPATAKHCAGSP